MNLVEASWRLLAASAGDTVKLFDVAREPGGDPCTLSYTPSPGCLVNSVKWNHANLVLASAGEDKKISLWRKNGQSMGTIPVTGMNSGDYIEESILAISFCNKGSRYLCSGGTGQVVRIWDLQKRRCIKWLRGHTNTIAGVMCNCKDEHLASISVGGDLIVHNLASGARASELKDPNAQVLRVLDYSRASRHLLVTAGDDGTLHLWDTTGRRPKMSWLKQHSAPAAGVCFSPSNEKIIASVGLDKKLYTYDTGSRRPSSCIHYKASFCSLAFGDNGYVLAAGTGNGRVVFYDVRGKPQPLTALHAYGSSEAVTSLCWQTSKPILVNEKTCTAEMALLGDAVEDSVVMPDPLPSMTSSTVAQSTVAPSSSHVTGDATSTMILSSEEETPNRGHLWRGGSLARLHAVRASYNFKDDMEVFSPLVDVHPITPSFGKLWDDNDGLRKDCLAVDKKPSSLFSPSGKRFSFADEGSNEHPTYDWKQNSISKQDDTRSSFAQFGATPTPSKSEDSAITPPEAWGGEKLSDKFNLLGGEKLSDKVSHLHIPSRLGSSGTSAMSSVSMFSSSLGQTSISSLTNPNMSSELLRARDVYSNLETSSGFTENLSSSSSFLSAGIKGITGTANLDLQRLAPLNFPQRLSTYAERISAASSFSDGTSLSVGSPKTKKTGAETRVDVLNSSFSRTETAAALEPGILPEINGGRELPVKPSQSDLQWGSNFTLQLFQRTLEETLDSFQKSIHEDMRNLHIEILRQFHMQEMEMSSVLSSIVENQAELVKEIKSLREETQQLRQVL